MIQPFLSKLTRQPPAVFVLILLIAMEISAMPSDPLITLYNVDDGMSDNIVNCIVKDSSGFIWISQQDNTISRFDGDGFTSYPPDENKGWNGFQSWRGGLTALANGNFRISSSSSIAEYDIRSDGFHEFLEVIYSENPGIQRVKGQCHLQKDTVWFFENNKIRKLEPEKYTSSGYKETILLLDDNIGRVTSTQEGPDGKLWIGTKNGLYFINQDSGQFKLSRCTIVLKDNPAPSQNVWRILFTNNNMWFISNDGIVKSTIQNATDSTSGPVLSGEAIAIERPDIDITPSYYPLNMVSDGSEFIFFRTSMGIYRYSIQNNGIVRLFSEPIGTEDWPRGHYQFALLYDDNGLLWAGSRKGLLKINLGSKKFHEIISFPELDNGLSGFNPSQVLVDQSRRLWVGTTTNGLYMSLLDDNGSYKEFLHFLPDPKDSSTLFHPAITFLYEDSKNNVYVASGINAGKVQQINIKGNKVSFRTLDGPGAILRMAGLPDGRIFITPSRNPPWIYDPETDKGYPYFLDKETEIYHTLTLQYTSDQNYYLRTMRYANYGHEGFYEAKSDPQFTDDGFGPRYYTSNIRRLLDSSDINSMYTFHVTESADYKESWIFGDGELYRHRWAGDLPENEKPTFIKKYDEQDGLKTTRIFEIFEDHQHRIWFTSPNGLYCLNPRTDEILRYYKNDGLKTSIFYWGKHIDETGNIFLCSNEGVIYFHPDSIHPDKSPPVYITGISIFDEPLRPGPDSPLNQSVLLTDKIVLPYNQNSITFDFVALDYSNTGEIAYRYKLESLEEKWIRADGRNSVYYAYLRPGNYNFSVIAANSNGKWNKVGASLDIRIKPPPWFSWWAFSLYFFILLWIMLWYRRYLQNKAKLNKQLVEERIEKDKSRELIQMRTRFFTNISHEFRTPLSLILGPVEDLLQNSSKEVLVPSAQLKLIQKNASRLRRLISQLLDLSKLETGKVSLSVKEGDLTEHIRSIALSFISLAESKDIEFDYKLQELASGVYFDPDKVEKIITNLISNAFKYTPENGHILITLEYEMDESKMDPSQVVLTVQDSGKGIPEELLSSIFDRFFQVDSTANNEYEGSGIGLALSKELVDVCKGQISVESEIGKGTRFRVSLPVSRDHFKEEDLTGPDEMIDLDLSDQTYLDGQSVKSPDKTEEAGKHIIEDLPLILVVEDHSELRNYIKQHLDASYLIHEAENGKLGLELALEILPDLIITDLMMPDMDGLEMCQKIREDEITSHIPVIMLTAKADQQSKLTGLQFGADDYLVKPFDSEELKVRVRNLIDQRSKLREKFSQAFFASKGQTKLTGADERFLQKAVKIINDNISDDQFTVEMFCDLLGVSNSNLNRKLKALAGLTPSMFIRNLRLKHSLVLLEAGYDNIARIAHEVGFSDHSYFSKCFRELYETSPTEYIIRRNTDSAK